MSLTVGVNSWVSVAEADTYFTDRWASSNWATLSNAEKESLLITSYRWVQAQSFFNISPSSIEEKIKNAQIELAWYIYKFFDESEKRRALYAQGVRKFTLSKWEETLEEGTFPSFIIDMLEDELINLGGYFPIANRELSN